MTPIEIREAATALLARGCGPHAVDGCVVVAAEDWKSAVRLAEHALGEFETTPMLVLSQQEYTRSVAEGLKADVERSLQFLVPENLSSEEFSVKVAARAAVNIAVRRLADLQKRVDSLTLEAELWRTAERHAVLWVESGKGQDYIIHFPGDSDSFADSFADAIDDLRVQDATNRANGKEP